MQGVDWEIFRGRVSDSRRSAARIGRIKKINIFFVNLLIIIDKKIQKQHTKSIL